LRASRGRHQPRGTGGRIVGMLLALFANPAFLPGLLSAGLPVVIHLLARQRAREIHFPSLRFLELTAQRTASRRRLEEIVLLLLRAGALTLLALALARPRLSEGGRLFGEGDLAVVIVADTSLSMDQEAQGRPAVARAREAAHAILAGLPAGARWALWLPCGQDEGDPLRAVRVRTDEERKRAPEAIRATGAHGRLRPLLQTAVEALRREADGAHEIHVLSDGQALSWGSLDDLAPALVRQQPIRCFLYTAEGTGQPNVAVEGVRVRARAPLVGEECRIEATLRACGSAEANVTAALYIGGTLGGRQKVAVPAGGATGVVFSVPLARAGWLTGMVQIEADACPRDNRGFFALEVREAIRVLIVDGNPSAIASERASHYVAAALAPGSGGAIRPTVVRPPAMSRELFGGVDCVVLSEVEDVGDEALAALKAFVQQGGTLVLVPGARTDPGVWNRRFGAATDSLGGLLPGEWTDVREFGTTGALGLAPGEMGDELVAPFAAVAGQALRRAKVYRAFGIRLGERSPAQVAVLLEDGSPFLLSKSYGSGRVAQWAAAPAPAWTSLQARPVFVPLIHAHAYLGLRLEQEGGGHCGNALALDLEVGSGPTVVRLQPPAGEGKALQRDGGSAAPLRYGDTWEEGIYEATYTQPVAATKCFAVNPAGEEGDLSQVDEARLLRVLSRLGPADAAHSLAELEQKVASARQGVDLQYALLVLAACLLFAEALFGAGRTRNA